MTDLEIENGCLGDGASVNDYLLMDGDADGLPALYLQDEVRYYYNQRNQDWSKKSCTIFSALGAISDLWNYKFTIDEIKEYDEESYSKGRVRGQGWYVQMAVSTVCKKRNREHPNMQVAYYRIDMSNDSLVDKVVNKNYNICTGFYGNSSWTLDYSKDGVLNGTSFGVTTYGHAINVINNNKKLSIKDNYDGRKYNVYEIANHPSNITTFHKTGYIITKVKEDSLERVKELNEMKTKIEQNRANNSELYHLTNSDTHKGKLHEFNEFYKDWLGYINEELKKYQ